MDLSVIVPVYNVERYLEGCVLSLLDQNLDPSRYEIVMVDDSSPDGSHAIAERLAARHTNIRIVTQSPNGGLGAARNRGLDEARGKYVLFVDPDDTIAPGCLGSLLEEMERGGLDMLSFGYRSVDERGEQVKWGPGAARISDPGVMTGQEYILRNEFFVMVWLYMYRREFLDANGLRMLPGVKHEDEEFTPRALCLCHRIKNYPAEVYRYLCRREGSITGAWDARNITDLIRGMGSLQRFLQSGAVTDRRVVDRIRFLMSVQLYKAMRQSLRVEGITPRQARRMMRSEGLLPLANPRGHLNRFFINHFLPGFVFYNTFVRRRK